MSGDDHSEQLNLLQTITLEVAAATDLSSALEIVLRRVCEKTGWVIGQAWVPNKEEAVLNFVSGWYCDDGELKPFKAVSEKSHFEPGIGLPGRVWKSKQPAWLENVTNDPNFPRATAARTAGLKTGVGIPILARSKVIAVLEFFMRESRSQNEQLVKVIAAVAAQLGLVMERRVIVTTRSDKGDVAEFTVRDFGSGLPKDRPDKVFDHFFSTKQKGMGMGLAIVRSIIEAHGGTISGENAPDRGARMVVRLPAARGEIQKSKAAA